MSTIREYHDQKHGGFDPETGIIYPIRSKEYFKNALEKEDKQREKEIGSVEKNRKQIEKIITILNNIKLNDGAKNDKEKQKILEDKINTAKELIYKTLIDVAEYIISITKLDSIKQDNENENQQQYLNKLVEADNFRKIKHNALIDDIKIAIRYISLNFRKNLNEKIYEKWEKDEGKRYGFILDVERIDLPKNIFLPDFIDINNRDHITSWALQIREIVQKLKERLKKELK